MVAARNNDIVGSRILDTLPPRASYEKDLNLNRLFALTEPGTYTVELQKRIPKHLGSGVVRSNKVTVTITP